jgi:hypothetical protein
MSKYTFKEFPAAYPGDAACLARIMIERHGGTTLFLPRLRCRVAELTARRRSLAALRLRYFVSASYAI